MTQSGARAATYADVNATEKVLVNIQVVPRAIAQSEQIARYFTEDLDKFLADTHIDLVRQLGIPPHFARSSREVLVKLSDDLGHMLRDSMITGIHLLLSNPDVDTSTGAYALRYHAEYTIRQGRDLRQATNKGDKANYNPERLNGHLTPPRGSWVGAKFALLIDWNPTLSARRRNARPPDYWFDWMPSNDAFDATSQVRFRDGGMAFDDARVVDRREWKSPGYKR